MTGHELPHHDGEDLTAYGYEHRDRETVWSPLTP